MKKMQKRPEILKVSDVMETKVHFLRGNNPVTAAIQKFNQHRISSAPVINNKHEVIGFLSESALIALTAIGADFTFKINYSSIHPSLCTIVAFLK